MTTTRDARHDAICSIVNAAATLASHRESCPICLGSESLSGVSLRLFACAGQFRLIGSLGDALRDGDRFCVDLEVYTDSSGTIKLMKLAPHAGTEAGDQFDRWIGAVCVARWRTVA
jgi:hypothetical protein